MPLVCGRELELGLVSAESYIVGIVMEDVEEEDEEFGVVVVGSCSTALTWRWIEMEIMKN